MDYSFEDLFEIFLLLIRPALRGHWGRKILILLLSEDRFGGYSRQCRPSMGLRSVVHQGNSIVVGSQSSIARRLVRWSSEETRLDNQTVSILFIINKSFLQSS